jgi:hypothetical protein
MSKRTGLVRRGGPPGALPTQEAAAAPALAGDVHELEAAAEIALPREHPRWLRDRFTVSAATKAIVDRLRPLAVRVFGFWDHRVHRVTLDDAVIGIDACGSYRCE